MRVTRITDLDHADLADYTRLTDVALRRVSEPAGGLYIAESTQGHRARARGRATARGRCC